MQGTDSMGMFFRVNGAVVFSKVGAFIFAH
jgi:hypothetical protein